VAIGLSISFLRLITDHPRKGHPPSRCNFAPEDASQIDGHCTFYRALCNTALISLKLLVELIC
ncbi:MAG TPA: hypothetical protein VJH68_05380, partial [Candidatus Nanoarchaeia archaeon]|nr:hypothetical protein [Candidatus Nanoarchaeia archaeon]